MGQDIPFERAHRLANADLSCPLGDAHQHDVHDANAAHYQRDTGNGSQKEGDGAHDNVEHVQDIGLTDNGKVVVGLVGDVVAFAQSFFDLRRRIVHQFFTLCLDIDDVHRPLATTGAGREEAALGSGKWNKDLIVLVHHAHSAFALHHADHLVLHTLDLDHLADGVFVGEKILGRVGPQYGDASFGIQVILCQAITCLHRQAAHLKVIRRDARDGDASIPTAIEHLLVALHLGSNLFHRGRVERVGQYLDVFQAEGLVAAAVVPIRHNRD